MQGAYVRSLADEDLCSVMALLYLAQDSWHAWRFGSRGRAALPATWAEEETAFKETVLRHGSWFLFAHVRGFFIRGRHGQRLAQQSLEDLRTYERGGDEVHDEDEGSEAAAPGVLMTLTRELATRLDVGTRGEVEREALLRVDEMVRGKQAQRPVTLASASPPSQRDEARQGVVDR